MTLTKRSRALAVLAVLSAAAAPAASARASTPPRAKPARIAASIRALGFPYTAAVCKGQGKPVRGAYASFRCAVTGDVTVTLWARPLRTGWCGSATSLKTCHRLTAPVYGPGDKCQSNGSYCSLSSPTAVALKAHLGHTNGPDYLCTPAGTNVYTCVSGDSTETVTWTRQSYGWLAAVSP